MENKKSQFGFQPENYKLLLIGLAINVLGFLLMIGGAAEDPNSFDASELFSARRITIAPMLIVAGYIVIIYAILKKKKISKD
jgi:hypothetical protein